MIQILVPPSAWTQQPSVSAATSEVILFISLPDACTPAANSERDVTLECGPIQLEQNTKKWFNCKRSTAAVTSSADSPSYQLIFVGRTTHWYSHSQLHSLTASALLGAFTQQGVPIKLIILFLLSSSPLHFPHIRSGQFVISYGRKSKHQARHG
ncbi:hypothetical protein RRG08_030685 [Elysia crispata]|uniref:Uncharacterized protein n=1 Tax=Elysia crispata TaxID=231223 RepID=A0AAE0YH92_9GAST|nr:hypothetical protein RRG08_030685 [Elysia crispata]